MAQKIISSFEDFNNLNGQTKTLLARVFMMQTIDNAYTRLKSRISAILTKQGCQSGIIDTITNSYVFNMYKIFFDNCPNSRTTDLSPNTLNLVGMYLYNQYLLTVGTKINSKSPIDDQLKSKAFDYIDKNHDNFRLIGHSNNYLSSSTYTVYGKKITVGQLSMDVNSCACVSVIDYVQSSIAQHTRTKKYEHVKKENTPIKIHNNAIADKKVINILELNKLNKNDGRDN